MIKVEARGDFKKTETYLNRMKRAEFFNVMSKYGAQGVAALSAATPKDTGNTAGKWSYEIVNRAGYHSVIWKNSHVEDGRPIAILLQYGHGTKNGGYVQGRDYIMPAIQPVFDKIAVDMWKEVTK